VSILGCTDWRGKDSDKARSFIQWNYIFSCHYRECKKSYSGDFFEGQSYHIGKFYDLKINKKPFRVMVVGQELGHRERKLTLDDRYMKMEWPGKEKDKIFV
jgi:hypothetical protein